MKNCSMSPNRILSVCGTSHPWLTLPISRTELVGCGTENINSLLLSFDDDAQSCERLEALLALSYSRIAKGFSGSCWHRMYTDASIIRSLVSLDASTARDAISRLDKAIIIAGAVGQGRLDLILSLIRRIQTRFLPFDSFKQAPKSQAPSSKFPPLQTFYHDIPAIVTPPSFMTFIESCRNRPFLMRKYASSWPAINEHPWSSTGYLRSVAGPARIVPVEVGADYRTDDWMQEFMLWDDFLSALEPTFESAKVLYMAQHNLLVQFPDLNGDIIIPDYVYSCPPPPEDYPQYKPPGNDEQLVINAWLGPRGTISPAHTVR